MKLHLPKLLRHAVLACIAAVAGVASTVGTAAITSGAVTFALLGSYAEAAVPNATYTDDGTTRTYTGTGVITVPAADSGITKIVFGMSEPSSGDSRSYFNAGFTCNTAVQIGTSAENGIDINDGSSTATYAFTGAISGEGVWRVMGQPTSKTKITGSMEGFTGQLIGGTAPTFQLATTCKASVVEIGKLQLVGNVAFTGGSAGDHASITLGNVTSNADTQLTLGEYTETTLNGTIALRKSIVNNGSITLGDNVVFDLTQLAAVDGVYTLFTNAVDLSGLDASDVSVNLSDGEAITLNTDGTISVVEGTVGNRIWKNDGATNTWAAVSDKNWTADGADAFFVNGCTVQFGESASATGETIDMVGNLKIGGMTVNGTEWEFTGSGSIGAWGTDDAIVGSGELALGEEASVSFSGGGNLLFTGITAGSESTLKITGGAELCTRTASAISLPELELNNGTLSIVPRDNTNARLQVGVQALVTAGESILETRRSGASYAADVTVSSLSGSGTIKFRSGSQEGMAAVFTIGGEANFSGEIHLVGNATDGGDRRVTLNLDSTTVAQNAVVKFSSSNNKQNLQFGVGVDGATVAGLDGSVTGNNSTLTIFSGKGTISSSAAAGDRIVRTLNIATTAADADWSTSATVLANLNLAKSGDGTQSFTGDLSAFNGTISVSKGVLNMSSIGSASSISLTSSGATLGVTGSTTTGEGDAAVTTPNSVNLTSGKSLSAVNGAVLNSALTLGGGSLTLGSDSAAWGVGNGLNLNNHELVFGADKTELSLNLGSVALAAGTTIDLFQNVAGVELAAGATLDTYFSGLAEALKTATLSLAEGRLVATLADAYESSATPPPAGATDYYWESGTGNWSDAKWSTTDGATSGQTTLPTSGTVNVVFNNAEAASISIGSGVSVNDMSVTAGTYTFTGEDAATLEVAGTLTVGSGAAADIKTAVEVGSISVAGTLGISQTIKVAEGGTVTLDEAGMINLQNFEPNTSTTSFADGANDFGTVTNTYKVFDGGSITGTIGTWMIDNIGQGFATFDASTGECTVAVVGEIYGVGSGSVNSSTVAGAEGFALNGGELVLDVAPTEEGYITATDKGGTLDLNGQTVAQSVLGTLEGATVLEGTTASVYDLGDATSLADNLSLSDTAWQGTVKMDDITTPTEDLDITSLGRDGSTIKMGSVNVKSLTSSSAAAVEADALTLGGASTVGGVLTLTGNTLTLGSADASLTAGSLSTTSGALTIAATSQDVLDALNAKASQGAVTLLTLTNGFTGELTQTDIVVPTRAAAPVEKYFTELLWNADKTQLSYASRVNPDYVDAQVEATTRNGLAGVAMLQQVLQQVNPQVTEPDSVLATVLNAVDAGELSEEGAAAVAGAATAVLGMAAHGDLDRQLQAIRNRTTTMGVDQSVVHHEMPYFNAWINAEGDYSELSDNGTEGGYKLNSWGGTVGFDVDITPTFTAGMALTTMYGDLDVTGADQASGELNTNYVSAFARYCASAWTHTFVATAGLSDITLDRTVMGEEIEGETDSVSFGLMYEVGRVFALDEDGTACLQPILNVTWRHTTVNGYEESGSDLALEVDDQTLDTVTFGVGARLQAIVGESMYNRTSIFECRLLAKFDVGDRQGSSENALVALPGAADEVESAERGGFGLEAGAGLTIPLGDEGGSLFMDASLELRADYTNVNGTVGYRVNF